jgi:purine-binding chemotaxis protein CheW
VETGIEKKRTVGFVVDAVSDVVSITEENLREAPDVSGTVDTRFVDKIGHLGNRMVIIINLNTFFTEKEQAVLETVVKKGS